MRYGHFTRVAAQLRQKDMKNSWSRPIWLLFNLLSYARFQLSFKVFPRFLYHDSGVRSVTVSGMNAFFQELGPKVKYDQKSRNGNSG